jgi:ABC-type polysaccharide/polyol phosphate transport system ATPase subunit
VTQRGAVSVRGLGKRYPVAGHADGVWALRGLGFELPAGAALAVVGENGSGKSTLLDLLHGSTRASEGSLEVGGPVAALLELGAGFFSELSGRENAVQAARLRGRSAAQARTDAEEAGAFAELGAFFDRPLRTYSAGMLMRLGFAVASTVSAPVTLVDEVLAVGDGYFQRRCIDRLLQLREAGTTLVVASHDLHALRGLCGRALWLRDGRCTALGPADEVIGGYEEHLRHRAAAGEPAGRSGTGEVTIRSVRLTDASGEPCEELRTGDTLRVEVVFETRQPLDSPIMGVALFRADGVYCHGPNTRADASLRGRYDGVYRLTAEFPELQLLGGASQASVAFYDKDHVYAYAWDHRRYPFRVVSDRPDHGLVALPHRFRVERLEPGEAR